MDDSDHRMDALHTTGKALQNIPDQRRKFAGTLQRCQRSEKSGWAKILIADRERICGEGMIEILLGENQVVAYKNVLQCLKS